MSTVPVSSKLHPPLHESTWVYYAMIGGERAKRKESQGPEAGRVEAPNEGCHIEGLHSHGAGVQILHGFCLQQFQGADNKWVGDLCRPGAQTKDDAGVWP